MPTEDPEWDSDAATMAKIAWPMWREYLHSGELRAGASAESVFIAGFVAGVKVAYGKQ